MTALFDADWIIYRSCYSGENRDFIQTVESVDFFIMNVLEALNPDEYKIFLSGRKNFRKEVDSTYKSNRTQEKPPFFYETRDYLINQWKAEFDDTLEADDLCATYQNGDTCVVGEDKDLLTIPGKHYRIKKKWDENCLIDVTEEEAARNFYLQLMTGDKIDGVEGLTNPAKLHYKKPPNFTRDTALPLLENRSKEEMGDIVKGLYQEVYGEAWFEKYDTRARLLFLKRSPTSEYYDHYA